MCVESVPFSSSRVTRRGVLAGAVLLSGDPHKDVSLLRTPVRVVRQGIPL
ncbi:hypothetical protein ACNPQM_06885 [Streptomyces sp. NPDC056231]